MNEDFNNRKKEPPRYEEIHNEKSDYISEIVGVIDAISEDGFYKVKKWEERYSKESGIKISQEEIYQINELADELNDLIAKLKASRNAGLKEDAERFSEKIFPKLDNLIDILLDGEPEKEREERKINTREWYKHLRNLHEKQRTTN